MTLRLSIAQILAGGFHRASKPTLSKVALRTGLEPTPASPLTERIVWGFVAIGCLLRLRQFLFDPALWNDESMLALNLIHRSPAELLKPLEYDQGAPIGFLLLEKMAQSSFGSSEMALRFLPLVCGIASLFLFKAVSSRFLSATGMPIAVGLFAIASPFYYSTEVKQYSSDVAIALMLYLLADSQLEMPLRLNRVIVFSGRSPRASPPLRANARPVLLTAWYACA